MPIYEYQCSACNVRHEFIQKFSEQPMRECPSCGEPALQKLISAAAFHLKGSGWYVTDFRDSDKSKAKSKDEDKSDKPTADASTSEAQKDTQQDTKKDTQPKASTTESDSKTKTTAADKAAASSSKD